jgi:DNA-binding CsgD family transcriptional regulator
VTTAGRLDVNAPCDVLIVLSDAAAAAALTAQLAVLAPRLAVCPYRQAHRELPPGTRPGLQIIGTDLLPGLQAVLPPPWPPTIAVIPPGADAAISASALADAGIALIVTGQPGPRELAAILLACPPPAAPPAALAPRLRRSAGPARLSSRERDVLVGIASGATNAEIARGLHLSPETIKSHLRRIYKTLGAKDRGHAVALAIFGGHIDVSAITPPPDSPTAGEPAGGPPGLSPAAPMT